MGRRGKIEVYSRDTLPTTWASEDERPRISTREQLAEFEAVQGIEAKETDAAQEGLRRAIEEPDSLYVPHPGAQIKALRSVIRGIFYLSGGNQYGKTFMLALKAWLVASQRHHLYCCPPSCKSFLKGSCGVHCCPQPSNGGADYRKKGCVAGEERPCPIHPALRYQRMNGNPLEVIIGCETQGLVWDNFYRESLVKFLPRTGLLKPKPTWTEDKKSNRIVDKAGAWAFTFISYQDVSYWAARKAVFVGLDELPQNRGIFVEAQARANTRGGQVMLSATAAQVAEGKALWIADIVRRRHDPTTRIQYVEGPSHENPFTDVERLIDASRAWTDQERDIRLLGKLNFLADSSVFNQEIIDIQSQFLREPEKRWVIGTPIESPAVAAYFSGPTVFPQGCELKQHERDDIEAERHQVGGGGVGCADCPPSRHCAAYRFPPASSAETTAARPRLTVLKPAMLGERHQVMQWAEHDPLDRYVLGADVALGGAEGDYSVASVGSFVGREMALQYRARCEPNVFAAVIAAIWHEYHCFLVIERNGPGKEVITRLGMDYHIPSSAFFYRKDKTDVMPSGSVVSQAGYVTTQGSKALGSSLEDPFGRARSPLEALRHALRFRRIMIRSAISIGEYQTYCRLVGGKIGAMPGCHDDCVTADMLMAFGLEYKAAEFTMQIGRMDRRETAAARVVKPLDVDIEPLPWEKTDVDTPWHSNRDFADRTAW